MTGEIDTKFLVIDSSGWIAYITADQAKKQQDFGQFFGDGALILVPTTVIFEVQKMLTIRQPDGMLAKHFLSIVHEMKVVSIDEEIASAAVGFAISYNLSMAQALTYSAAVANEATLVTSDNYFQFKSVPGTHFVPMG